MCQPYLRYSPSKQRRPSCASRAQTRRNNQDEFSRPVCYSYLLGQTTVMGTQLGGGGWVLISYSLLANTDADLRITDRYFIRLEVKHQRLEVKHQRHEVKHPLLIITSFFYLTVVIFWRVVLFPVKDIQLFFFWQENIRGSITGQIQLRE